MTIYVGTSGWHYKSWVGNFYPEAFPADQMLAFYAHAFDTVEVNSSFYRLPADDTLRRWAEVTPAGFTFAFKASRYLTHNKKLKDPEQPLGRILHAAALLRPKLGPILLQLPPRWRLDLDRFRDFLGLLPAGHRFVFEFRDKSWFVDPAYEALQEQGAAFCMYEFGDFRSPTEVTADFAYIRLHGPLGRYSGLYDSAALAVWAERMEGWKAEGKDCYCYFDNDERGYAIQNAGELKRMLDA